MTCAEGNTTINTSTNTNAKELKLAKVPKSAKVKSQAKDARTSSFSKAKRTTEVLYILHIFAFN
jgi:hypothetical protein